MVLLSRCSRMLSWLPADGPLYGSSSSALMGNLRQHLTRLASHRTFMWLMTFNVQSPSCRPDLGELSRRAWLRPDSTARRQSRTMIYTICHEWCIPHLIRSARTVTADLVHNAIELARTPSVFKVSLDDAGLRIALRDFRATQGFRLRPDSSVPPSLGRVVRFADSCGVTPALGRKDCLGCADDEWRCPVIRSLWRQMAVGVEPARVQQGLENATRAVRICASRNE